MINHSRHLCLYPNVYLMDQFSSQIRVLHPISVNQAEVTIYCIAPKGEPADTRARCYMAGAGGCHRGQPWAGPGARGRPSPFWSRPQA
jgi:hypothetical protein